MQRRDFRYSKALSWKVMLKNIGDGLIAVQRGANIHTNVFVCQALPDVKVKEQRVTDVSAVYEDFFYLSVVSFYRLIYVQCARWHYWATSVVLQ